MELSEHQAHKLTSLLKNPATDNINVGQLRNYGLVVQALGNAGYSNPNNLSKVYKEQEEFEWLVTGRGVSKLRDYRKKINQRIKELKEQREEIDKALEDGHVYRPQHQLESDN